MSESDQPPIEEVIDSLRSLADQAGAEVESHKSETDLSDVNPKHMALAELEAKRDAFQKAWALAISKREEVPEENG